MGLQYQFEELDPPSNADPIGDTYSGRYWALVEVWPTYRLSGFDYVPDRWKLKVSVVRPFRMFGRQYLHRARRVFRIYGWAAMASHHLKGARGIYGTLPGGGGRLDFSTVRAPEYADFGRDSLANLTVVRPWRRWIANFENVHLLQSDGTSWTFAPGSGEIPGDVILVVDGEQIMPPGSADKLSAMLFQALVQRDFAGMDSFELSSLILMAGSGAFDLLDRRFPNLHSTRTTSLDLGSPPQPDAQQVKLKRFYQSLIGAGYSRSVAECIFIHLRHVAYYASFFSAEVDSYSSEPSTIDADMAIAQREERLEKLRFWSAMLGLALGEYVRPAHDRADLAAFVVGEAAGYALKRGWSVASKHPAVLPFKPFLDFVIGMAISYGTDALGGLVRAVILNQSAELQFQRELYESLSEGFGSVSDSAYLSFRTSFLENFLHGSKN